MGEKTSVCTQVVERLYADLRRRSGVESQFNPSIPEHFLQYQTRGDGIAMTDYLSPARRPVQPRRARELEITDGGTLRIFTARATDDLRGVEYILPAGIVGLTMQALHLASRLSDLTN